MLCSIVFEQQVHQVNFIFSGWQYKSQKRLFFRRGGRQREVLEAGGHRCRRLSLQGVPRQPLQLQPQVSHRSHSHHHKHFY